MSLKWSPVTDQLYAVSNSSPSLDLNFAANKTLDDNISGNNLITFSRASSGTYVDASGVIQTAADNVPRFDHDPTTLQSLGLLIEEERTNVLQYSEDFTATGWASSQFTLSNASSITAPDGSSNTTLMVPTASGYYVELTYPTGLTGIRTHSVFAKAEGKNYINLGARMTGGAAAWNIQFDLTTGAQTRSSTSVTGTSQQLANGWWRITAVVDATIYSGNLAIGACDQGDILTTPDGTGIYIWGAQTEAATFPTSYIPTSGSTVTREPDVASITGTNFSSWYEAAPSTWLIDYDTPYVVQGVHNPTLLNLGVIGYWDGPSVRVENETGYFTYWDNSSPSVTEVSNVGMSVLAGRYALSIDSASGALTQAFGGVAVPETFTARPATVTTGMYLGLADESSFKALNGHITRLTYYPYRLSDTILQEITS